MSAARIETMDLGPGPTGVPLPTWADTVTEWTSEVCWDGEQEPWVHAIVWHRMVSREVTRGEVSVLIVAVQDVDAAGTVLECSEPEFFVESDGQEGPLTGAGLARVAAELLGEAVALVEAGEVVRGAA